MKAIAILSLAAITALFLLTACSTVNWATPAKAGFEPDQESWALRYIPGVKALSNAIPPPTEERLQWDEYQKSRGNPSIMEGDMTRPLP